MQMVFEYYPRYASMIIIVIFNVIVTIATKQNSVCIVFFFISIVLAAILFSIKYVIDQDKIIEYIFFIKAKSVNINEIKMVETVNVKQIGTIEIYIGKKANAVKEDGYYLIMKDDSLIKIDSGYRNKEGITLGKYIINNYKLRNKYIEKYKLFNDRL
jgi:hypothetical protein